MFFYMSCIRVRKAKSKADYEKVEFLRDRSFDEGDYDQELFQKKFDKRENSSILIAEDMIGNPLGCLRIMNRSLGLIVLDQYRNVESMIKGGSSPIAEVTCFIVLPHLEEKTIILALYKAFYRYCEANGIATAILSYKEDLREGLPEIIFDKPPISQLYWSDQKSTLDRYTYFLDMKNAKSLYSEYGELLYEYMINMIHRNISYL